MPLSAHGLAPKSQLDQAGVSVSGQSESIVQPTQAWRASSHTVPPVQGLPGPGWQLPSPQVSKPSQ